MDSKSEHQAEIDAEAKQKAEARTARLLALIFGGMIVAMIGGMFALEIYGENQQGQSHNAPADAADR